MEERGISPSAIWWRWCPPTRWMSGELCLPKPKPPIPQGMPSRTATNKRSTEQCQLTGESCHGGPLLEGESSKRRPDIGVEEHAAVGEDLLQRRVERDPLELLAELRHPQMRLRTMLVHQGGDDVRPRRRESRDRAHRSALHRRP